MKRLKNKIFHNFGLKLASLLLASALWFLVAQIGDPQDVTYFSNVPVKMLNTQLLDQENKVYEVLDGTDYVRVSIRAPRSVTRNLRASDIVAEADISKLTDINTVAISFSVQNQNTDSIKSIKGDHEVVRLNVEDRLNKWIKLQSRIEGEVAEGYMVASAVSDQNMIEISGPRSVVEKVNYAAVTVDVTGATSKMTLNVETELYNIDGEPIEPVNLKKNVNYVLMTVDVLATKEVPIELNVMGVPAEGYLATGKVECEPANVKIAGTTATLAGISKIVIPESVLNITGESTTMETIVNVKDYLGDSVRLADSSFNGRISAFVEIEPEAKKTLYIESDRIHVNGLPEGYELEMPERAEPYEIVIAGLNSNVQGISAETIVCTLDIEDWMREQELEELREGTYDIPVSFSVPDTVTIKNTPVLHVTISKMEDEE